jgi:hypothetical protein
VSRQNEALPAPLNFAGLMASSWHVYTSLFTKLFVAGFVVFAIADLIQVGARSFSALDSAGSVAGGLRLLLPFAIYIFFASFLVALVGVGVADSTAGMAVSGGSMWRGVRAVVKDVVAANLLAVVVALTLVVLLAFFPILFLPLFFGPPLIVQVVALERKRLQEAVPRARLLVRGQLARTLLALFCVALGARLVQGVVLDRFLAVSTSLVTAARVVLYVLTEVILEATTVTFFAVVATLAYFDVRARTEDFGPNELQIERRGAAG